MKGSSATPFWHRLDAALARLRGRREALSLLLDALVVVLAWQITYLFRLGFERWLPARPGYDALVLLGVVVAYLAALKLARVPQSMWRFTGFGEVKRLALACCGAGLVSAVVVLMAQLREVPRAVLLLHPWFALIGMVMMRLAYRALYEQARQAMSGGVAPKRAIVMGAGHAARRLLAGIDGQGWNVVALLDDDPARQGARVAGVPVLGALDTVAQEAARLEATHVIVALPTATREQRRRALQLAGSSGRVVQSVPAADELRDDGADRPIDRLRDIEPEELLGREPVVLDETGVGQVVGGRCVLVTGAGGSIGSELCRQVARFEPARLVLYEQSEFNLYTIEQELGERFPSLPIDRVIGDVKDVERLREVFAATRPAIVFHAAAYKHVPLMEDDINVVQALRNNTLGTLNAATVAAESGCDRFVLISTDKAVNPTNVMGATKRAAELVISAMAAEHPGTRFMAVRFGNVLGSSGSVIPKFKEQIARGGPVTVTHPDVVRYFMTIPEAVRLVVQAAAIGESGQVLVLDMGEPVRIADLARSLIRLAGRTDLEVPIRFTGLRPGEKLYEELLSQDEDAEPTTVQGLKIARLAAPDGSLASLLAQAMNLESSAEGVTMVRALFRKGPTTVRQARTVSGNGA